MKQVYLSGRGEIQVLETPVPARLPGSILVRTEFSLISQGTEGAAVTSRTGVLGMFEKAMQSTDRTRQIWDLVRKEGVDTARRVVLSKLEDLTPIGYSSAGTVVEVSDAASPFRVGDRVACMGVGFAPHAEYAVVPRQLAAKVPDGVPLDQAAFGAVACIAMQGIRRLELTPGETIVVAGLGLIGQLCVQLANAMGYRVLGLDLSESKARFARECGALDAWALGDVDSQLRVRDWTGGHGADGVVICAAASSDEPLNQAFDLCRRRGRVSIVGDVGLGAERSKMYQKELEMRMSCSYGPGRYDPAYELRGQDYPIAHARWTEGRNLAHFLDLLAMDRLKADKLISRVIPVEEAPAAYRAIKGDSELYGMLFSYPVPEQETDGPPADTSGHIVYSDTRIGSKTTTGVVRLGLIGCGGFTKAVHLPNLQALTDRLRVTVVASRSGATAAAVAKRMQADVATSDHRRVLDDPDVDAVLIATRHATHGRFVEEALQAGKHVFVEKPLAITMEECERLVQLERDTGLTVRVGFNRRFAPLYVRAKKIVAASNAAALTYRVNIGEIGEHWSNTEVEGGRLLGEGCHFFDLFNWFFDSVPDSVIATAVGEPVVTNPNVTVLARYPNGSTGTLIYTSLGSERMGKERLEGFCGGRSFVAEDFESLSVYGGRGSSRRGRRDKGHRAELEEFAAAITGKEYPLPGANAQAGTLATWMALAAYDAAREGSAQFWPDR